jgi:general secretion pathway protein K
VEAIDELRRDIASGKQTVDFQTPNWLNQVPGMGEIKLDPKLITMTSDIFRVASTATLNDATTTVTAIVERVQAPQSGKWSCRLLSWQVD